MPITVAMAGDHLFLRVELALIVTVSVATVLMAVVLERRLRDHGVHVFPASLPHPSGAGGG